MTAPAAHRNAPRITGVHATHDMQAAGNDDTGKRRYICASCKCGATWPEAAKACGVAFVDGRLRAVVPLTADRIARITPPPPKPHETWGGALSNDPPQPCNVCRVLFVRPLRFGHVSHCGPTCSAKGKCAVRNRSREKMRPPETHEQKQARLERQRVARRVAKEASDAAE